MSLYIDDRWKTFKMLCIDPGKHYLGASIHEIDTRTGAYHSIEVVTLKVDKTYMGSRRNTETTSITDQCLSKIDRHIYTICKEYDVSVLAYESPFYNRLMPGAYGSLCEVVGVVRQAALDYYGGMFVCSMSPQNVKKGMGAGGSKGKEIMLEKVSDNRELMRALVNPIEDLTEHCIDSLAVGLNARNTILAPMEGWKI